MPLRLPGVWHGLANSLQNAFELVEAAKLDLDFSGPLLVGVDLHLRAQKIRQLLLQTQNVPIRFAGFDRFRRLERLLHHALGIAHRQAFLDDALSELDLQRGSANCNRRSRLDAAGRERPTASAAC